MKKLLVFPAIVISIISMAQNVGIGTTTPQATLDVKGNVRTGGTSNFILYDTTSGKISWTNSNLFVTTPQYLMKHSASAEGLYSNGAQLEYRNQLGNPIFYTNWSNGNGFFSGNLGIGITNPTAKFQIKDGASGITPFFSARMVVETNSHTYINLLSPDPFETGILFGSGTQAVSGLISYNSTTVPKGFIFNNNGNQTRMVIDNAGNVGIGTTAPASKLEITHDGASVYGTALSLNQDVIGNADGPKIQFKKTMTSPKSWTAGILNGVDVGTFSINEDGGTGGFGTPRFTIAPGGNIGITGALAINGNTGIAGQVLTSNGNTAPAWNNKSKYFFFHQTGGTNLTNAVNYIPGVDDLSFSTTFTSTLIVTVSSSLIVSPSEPDQGLSVNMLILTQSNVQLGNLRIYSLVHPGVTLYGGGNITSTISIPNFPAGVFYLSCYGQRVSGTGINGCSDTQVIIQAIPQ